MRGVLLAGGTGSRLHPLTLVTNKHLLPVHDRPMIHYPIDTLRGMGINEVMVILGGRSIGDIVELLADGHDLGIDLTYRYQRGALGIAHAIGLARDFVGSDPFCVVLGDNILKGAPLLDVAQAFERGPWGAGTLLYRVPDPERFGVAEFGPGGDVVHFEEKPSEPRSDSIPIGVYFLRPDAFDVIAHLQPSGRGEFEITDVLNHYIGTGGLYAPHFDGTWQDAGTIDSLLHASMVAAGALVPGIDPRRRSMRLLVTGGAGFIGSTFVHRRLAASPADTITVIDRLTYAGNPANLAGLDIAAATRDRFRFVHGDIADGPLVEGLAQDVDAIVNFAAESHVDRSILEPAAFLRTGVLGVHALLEAMRKERDRRGDEGRLRLLQVSTDEIYGPVPVGRSTEDDPIRPSSPYSAAKAAGEHLVMAYRETYHLDVVITRGANTYGPNQYPEKLIPLFITNAIDDQPLPMYGDGMQRRDWLHVDDHADAIATVLDRGIAGLAYNVSGEGVERPNREVTQLVLEELGKPWSLVRSVPDRPGHDRRYALDGARLHALGWAPRVAFEDGLRATVRWYRDNQAWWRAIKDPAFDDYYRRQYAWRLEGSAPA